MADIDPNVLAQQIAALQQQAQAGQDQTQLAQSIAPPDGPNMGQMAGAVNPAIGSSMSGFGYDQNGMVRPQSNIPVTQNDPYLASKIMQLQSVYDSLNGKQQGNIDQSNAARQDAIRRAYLTDTAGAELLGQSPSSRAAPLTGAIDTNMNANSALNAAKLGQQQGLFDTENKAARQAYEDARARTLSPQEALTAQQNMVGMGLYQDPDNPTGAPIYGVLDKNNTTMVQDKNGQMVPGIKTSKGLLPVTGLLPYTPPTQGTAFNPAQNRFTYTNTNGYGQMAPSTTNLQPNAPVGFVQGPDAKGANTPIPAGEAENASRAKTMIQNDQTVNNLMQQGFDPTAFDSGLAQFASDKLDKYAGGLGSQSVLSGPHQVYNSAVDNWIFNHLRGEFTRAQNPEAYEKAEKEYFPQPGDKPATVQYKAALRQNAAKDLGGANINAFAQQNALSKQGNIPKIAGQPNKPVTNLPPGIIPNPNGPGFIQQSTGLPVRPVGGQ